MLYGSSSLLAPSLRTPFFYNNSCKVRSVECMLLSTLVRSAAKTTSCWRDFLLKLCRLPTLTPLMFCSSVVSRISLGDFDGTVKQLLFSYAEPSRNRMGKQSCEHVSLACWQNLLVKRSFGFKSSLLGSLNSSAPFTRNLFQSLTRTTSRTRF